MSGDECILKIPNRVLGFLCLEEVFYIEFLIPDEVSIPDRVLGFW
jgi:hypothetical protein